MADVGQFTVRWFEERGRSDLSQADDWRRAALDAANGDGADAATVESDRGDGPALAVAVAEATELAWDCSMGTTHELLPELSRPGRSEEEIAALQDRVVRRWAEVGVSHATAPVTDVGICLAEFRGAFAEEGFESPLLLTAETVRPNGSRIVHAVDYFVPSTEE